MTDGLVAALARAQANFPTIQKGHTNPHFRSKYADLSDVLAAVRPVLACEGIALMQPIRTDDDGRVRLCTVLAGHGETLESELPLYMDGLGPQQLGSLLSYYRRYQLTAMLGIAAEDDDDGNAAQTAPQAQARSTPPAALPEFWDKEPLTSFTFAELRVIAEHVGHTFTGGSKAELIRQLEPLVRSLSSEEPFDLTPPENPPEPKPDPADKPFEPVVSPVSVARSQLSGSERKRLDSANRAPS